MFGKRKLEQLTVEELERVLLIKRRQSRLERFQRFAKEGRSVNEALIGSEAPALKIPGSQPLPKPDRGAVARPGQQPPQAMPLESPNLQQDAGQESLPREKSRSRKVMEALLLGLEIVALAGLIGVLVASYFNLKELNNEVSLAQQSLVKQQSPAPSPAPITLARLPGGHTPPTSPGGAVPDVPLHLQQWVQPAPAKASLGPIEISQDAKPPTRIVIPKIKVDAPIVYGVTWEDLKKGVGHLPGSANPGERGNLYLAAHNDIYGEIFRYLEDLAVGDEYFIYAGQEKFKYVVKERRVIDPSDVEVMLPTTEAVATLQTCYPYLVDTHRLVVIGELAK
jgi:sortase A